VADGPAASIGRRGGLEPVPAWFAAARISMALSPQLS
jgi:hypothetical protein